MCIYNSIHDHDFPSTFPQTHLPGYVRDFEKIKGEGIDVVACISVNDAFVMASWGKAQNTDGKIRMLADTNGEFTKVTTTLMCIMHIVSFKGQTS